MMHPFHFQKFLLIFCHFDALFSLVTKITLDFRKALQQPAIGRVPLYEFNSIIAVLRIPVLSFWPPFHSPFFFGVGSRMCKILPAMVLVNFA